MRRTRLIKAAIFTTLALGTLGALTACDNGEAVSSARVSVAKSPTTTAAPSTTPSTTAADQPPATSASQPPASTPPLAQPATNTQAQSTVKPVSNAVPQTLAVIADPKLGKIVAVNGWTLYRINTDSANPPKSNCAGDCAKRFPPLLLPADGIVHVNGIDPTLIGKLTRADRTIQVTLAGHPLYRFAGDIAPGDTLGHNLAGAFAITATGTAAQTR